TQRRGERGEVAGPGCVRRGAERSSSGSTFMIVVVSSGGIHAHPAADAAGRGRLHPANPDPPGANHHIKRSLKFAAKPPQRLRTSAPLARPRRRPRPSPFKRASAFSAAPREPLLLRASA